MTIFLRIEHADFGPVTGSGHSDSLLCTACYREVTSPVYILPKSSASHSFVLLLANPSSRVIANHGISAVYCAPATADMLRIRCRSLEVRGVDWCRSGRSRR